MSGKGTTTSNLTGDFHTMKVAIADYRLEDMTDEQIINVCPLDYGTEITDDHLNLVWDRLYTELDNLDEIELLTLYEHYLALVREDAEGEEDE